MSVAVGIDPPEAGRYPAGMNRMLSLGVVVCFLSLVAAQPPTEPKLNTAATKSFAGTVQPVLSNVCADCHAHPKHTSTFKLKAYDPAYSDPPAAEANLKAITKLLDPTNPHSSPLLTYTTTAHGKMTEPPLKADHPAYKKLSLWVHWATAADGSAAPTMLPPPPAEKTVIQAGGTQPAPAPSPAEPGKLPPLKSTTFAKPDPKKANPDDPFDPAAFNKK